MSVLLGSIATIAAAWVCAFGSEMDEPIELTFQAARTHDDQVLNVLSVRYADGHVIAARVHDEHSVPRRVSEAHSALIGEIYATYDERVTVQPVVEAFDDVALPAWASTDRWAARTLAAATEAGRVSPHEQFRVEQGFGWPFATMRIAFTPTVGLAGWERGAGIPIKSFDDRSDLTPDFLPRERVLPIVPTVVPFTLSTLLYGGAAFVMLMLLRGARAGLRRVRGRCPSCGYDVGHVNTPQCPECGKVLQRTLCSESPLADVTSGG